MTNEQIKHMANRFLGWKLPADFSPDCGIHFDADAAKKMHPNNHRYEPIGTNLLTATQAEAMVQHIVAGMPDPERKELDGAGVAVHWIEIIREWFGRERYARDYEYLDANYGKQATQVADFLNTRLSATTPPEPKPEPVDELEALLGEVMQDAWGEICDDAGAHPSDIRRDGRKLFYDPGHWTKLIAIRLQAALTAQRCLTPAKEGVGEDALREAAQLAVSEAGYHLRKYRPFVLDALQAALAGGKTEGGA